MTQDDLRKTKCQEIKSFMETNLLNPSKHSIEEHLMLNWLKHNRKLMDAGKMKAGRMEKFNYKWTVLTIYNNYYNAV